MNIEQARRTQVFTPLHIVRDMIKTVPCLSGSILDLCAGEGVFTYVLIEEFKVDPCRITLIEIDPILCDKLRKKFPLCNIIEGDLFEATKGCAGKFDVIFSNPPYQVMDGGGGYGSSSRPIYHEIVINAIDNIQPRYVSMITPSRWMAGGKGLNDYRARMITDKRIKLIRDFPGEKEVFINTEIQGGVSYFLWDKEHNGDCEFNGYKRPLDEFDIVIRDNTAISILKKVLDKHHVGQFCDKKVLPRKPFGLPTNFKDWVPNSAEGAVKCYVPKKDGLYKFIKTESVKDSHGIFKKWNVFTGSTGRGARKDKDGRTVVISPIFVGEYMTACLESYIVVNSFSKKSEAENFKRYMKTKFFRYCLMIRLSNVNTTKDRFAWVPDLQDYTRAYTDQDLYKHFGLTKQEIDHIESTIKELK